MIWSKQILGLKKCFSCCFCFVVVDIVDDNNNLVLVVVVLSQKPSIKSLAKSGSVIDKLLLIWTKVITKTNVAWTNVTVHIC